MLGLRRRFGIRARNEAFNDGGTKLIKPMEGNHQRGACKSEGALWLLGGAALGLILTGVAGCERSPDQSVISSPTTKPRPITITPTSGGLSAVVEESAHRSESPPTVSVPRIKPLVPIDTRMRTRGDIPGATPAPISAAQESPILIPEPGATGQTSGASELVEPTRSELLLKAAPAMKPPPRNEGISTPRSPPVPIDGPPVTLSPNIDG